MFLVLQLRRRRGWTNTLRTRGVLQPNIKGVRMAVQSNAGEERGVRTVSPARCVALATLVDMCHSRSQQTRGNTCVIRQRM